MITNSRRVSRSLATRARSYPVRSLARYRIAFALAPLENLGLPRALRYEGSQSQDHDLFLSGWHCRHSPHRPVECAANDLEGIFRFHHLLLRRNHGSAGHGSRVIQRRGAIQSEAEFLGPEEAVRLGALPYNHPPFEAVLFSRLDLPPLPCGICFLGRY